MSKNGPKPAFLNAREIRELAASLKVQPHIVATVLQVAGHALRERYRKRGVMPPNREKPPKGFRDHNPPGTGRTDIAAVLTALADDETASRFPADVARRASVLPLDQVRKRVSDDAEFFDTAKG